MRHYNAKTLEFTKEGFSDLFILNTANTPATAGGAAVNDFSAGLSNKQITLTALVAGDLVLDAVIDVKTVIAGPTGAPTAQVKTSVGAVAITPLCAVKTATGVISDNTVVGRTMSTQAENLVLDLQVGGGDGAVPTAGELWIWANISRAGRLLTQA